MKALLLLFLVFSATTFAAEVGENMKSECTKIISEERSTASDVSSSSESSEEVESVIGQ